MEYVTLKNGVEMPMLGFGAMIDAPNAEQAVLDAIACGYRLIDTAQAYDNEEQVGNAIVKSGVPREELFLTTKVWITNAGFEKAQASIDESLKKLQTDYLDLLLIHQPFSDYYGTWRAMEKTYRAGKVRAIGVSNFYPDRLIDICSFAEIPPMVNQVETHVLHQQGAAHVVMEKYGVVHEAWSPFAEGKKDFFENPVLMRVGERHQKTPAQIALRFLLQKGVVVIPKSIRAERMRENYDVFNFTLDQEDMAALTALDEKESAFFSHYDPQTVEFIIGLCK